MTTNPKFKDFTNEQLYKMYSETKDVAIRNDLMLRNRPLVTYILGKYYMPARIPAETREELLQEGMIGLLYALEGFDHTLGFKFSTYACWWIKQAVNNYLINVNPIIRVPSHIKAAQNKLQKRLKLTNKDLCDMSDISPEDYDLSPKMFKSIQSALKSKQVISLNKPMYSHSGDGEGNSTFEDLVPDQAPEVSRNIDKELVTNALKQALKCMPEKRRLVLLLRYDVISEKDIPKCSNKKKKTLRSTVSRKKKAL